MAAAPPEAAPELAPPAPAPESSPETGATAAPPPETALEVATPEAAPEASPEMAPAPEVSPEEAPETVHEVALADTTPEAAPEAGERSQAAEEPSPEEDYDPFSEAPAPHVAAELTAAARAAEGTTAPQVPGAQQAVLPEAPTPITGNAPLPQLKAAAVATALERAAVPVLPGAVPMKVKGAPPQMPETLRPGGAGGEQDLNPAHHKSAAPKPKVLHAAPHMKSAAAGGAPAQSKAGALAWPELHAPPVKQPPAGAPPPPQLKSIAVKSKPPPGAEPKYVPAATAKVPGPGLGPELAEVPPGPPPLELYPQGVLVEQPPGPPAEFPGGLPGAPGVPMLGGVPLVAPTAMPLLAPMPMVLQMPTLPAEAAGALERWEENIAPQGCLYYFCKRTGESRWERPSGPGDVIVRPNGTVAAPVSSGTAGGPAALPASGPDMLQVLGEPESWETIGKTGWQRVETEHGYKYFYHKKTKRTAWTCPPEIAKQVAALDGALSAPGEEEQKAANTPDPQPATAGAAAGAPPGATPAEGDKEAPAGAAKADGDGALEPKASKQERADRREEEQKAARAKAALKNFKQLLLEKGVKPFDKYETWLPKLLHDSRWTAIMKDVGKAERKALFEVLAKRIDGEKRKQAATAQRSKLDAFKEILDKAIQRGLLDGRALSSAKRAMEDRFGEEEAWDGLPEKQRDKLIAEAYEERAKEREKKHDGAVRGFRALIQEILRGKEEAPSWKSARRDMEKDPRWEDLDSSAERQLLFDQAVKEFTIAQKQKQKRRRQEEEDVEKARKARRLGSAEQDLLALLTERIKAPHALSWEDAKAGLADSARLKACGLNDEEQERLFEDFKREATEARRRAFILLLTNAPGDLLGPEMSFEQAAAAVVDVVAAKSFAGMPQEVLRSAWEEWREQASQIAVEDCRKWLRSCEHFRHADGIVPGSARFEELLLQLQEDVRFRRLSARPEEQRRLAEERLQELREQRAKGRSGPDEDELV